MSIHSYLRPGTIHAVFGVEPTIIYGRHFLSSSNISESVFMLIHCFILGDSITNSLSMEGRRLHFQYLAWIEKHYSSAESLDGKFYSQS